mgnify:CR=1 FL=1
MFLRRFFFSYSSAIFSFTVSQKVMGGLSSNFHSLLVMGRPRSEKNILPIGNPIWPPGGHLG